MIDLNITLAIQIVNFIIALIVLNFVLVRPIRVVLKQRRDLVSGLLSETSKFNEESSWRLKKYESDLDAARSQASEQRETIKQQGIAFEANTLENAQNEAQSVLQKSRKDVEQEAGKAMLALRARVDLLAGKVVAKVLG